jgi:hypothetical protein
MDAIAEDMKDMPPREVNTNMLANAADATFTAGSCGMQELQH